MNKMHIYKSIDVDKINRVIKKNPFKVVNFSEQQYTNKLDNITSMINDNHFAYKIVLLAGPSSSGKTTTANLLKDHLRAKGIGAWLISLDDFFLGTKKIRKLNDEPDYESLQSLDLPLIHKCLDDLITKLASEFPIFDFITNERSRFTRKLQINKNDIVILEGLHALNPQLLLPSYSSKCLKIYVSISTSYKQGNNTVISPKDLRLIRRIIRDYKFRNTTPYETFKMWPKVCDGEKKHIDPFKETAQIFIDSCLNYEPCIFYKYLEEIIKISDKFNHYYKELLKIYDQLTKFNKLDSSIIPTNSILREFIGLS